MAHERKKLLKNLSDYVTVGSLYGLQDAAQPVPYLLYQRPWTPLRLLGHHPIGGGIQEPNPTRSRRNNVLL